VRAKGDARQEVRNDGRLFNAAEQASEQQDDEECSHDRRQNRI